MRPHAAAPTLLGLFFQSLLIGALVSALFVAMIVTFDVGRIGSLLSTSGLKWPLLFILWLSQVGLFGALQFAWTICEIGGGSDDRGSGPGRALPVRVKETDRP